MHFHHDGLRARDWRALMRRRGRGSVTRLRIPPSSAECFGDASCCRRRGTARNASEGHAVPGDARAFPSLPRRRPLPGPRGAEAGLADGPPRIRRGRRRVESVAVTTYLIKQYRPRAGRAGDRSTSRSSSASSPGGRRPTRSSQRLAGPRALDPDGRGAAARRSRHDAAGELQGVPRAAAEETDPKLRGPGRAPGGCSRVRRQRGALQLDRRHAQRLAGPGAFPRAHRGTGSLGGRRRVSRSAREDEEPLLRHARARSTACATTWSSSSRTRPTTAKPRCT